MFKALLSSLTKLDITAASCTDLIVQLGKKHLKIITTIKLRHVHGSADHKAELLTLGRSWMANHFLLSHPVSYSRLTSSFVLLI